MFASFRLAAPSRAARTIAGAVVGCLTVLQGPAGASTASTKTTARTTAASAPELTQAEADQIAQEAYIYFYPLISMDLTRRILTAPEAAAKPGSGPANAFHHMRAFPTATFRDVVRPNFDTLYSTAWLDLTEEPLVVSHDDTKGRYFLLPMLDMWTDVVAVPGKRTTGTAARDFVVVAPGWQGQLPQGLERIDATTPYVWIIGRTQTNGTSDYPAVHAIQDSYRITRLSQWKNEAAPEATRVQKPLAPEVVALDLKTPPLVQVNTMKAERYFAYGAQLMALNPPHKTDWSQVARLSRLGLVPGQAFNFKKAPALVQKALNKATTSGLELMTSKLDNLAKPVNGWQVLADNMGVYGNSYLKRAIVAMVGLGANQPEDAIYPLAVSDSKGQPLLGGKPYVVRFEKKDLPPVDAFWSLTMYDEGGFQVPNELNRFALGDRDALSFGKDGSLEILIQPTSPGKDKESNWLPSPKDGKLGLTMRLYAPRPAALQGTWLPPAVTPGAAEAPVVQ